MFSLVISRFLKSHFNFYPHRLPGAALDSVNN